MDHAAGVKPRLPRRLRLFRQRAVTLHRQQRHPPPRGLCQTRNDISVAAVVAMSAEDQPVRAGRISTAGQLERRLARALHEFEQRQPQAVRRLSFGQAQRLRRPNVVWYTVRVFRHCMVHHVTAPRSRSVSATNQTMGHRAWVPAGGDRRYRPQRQ
ncbi:Uncharacterised protein [Klebsiella pneumoniae]|nr:Uncharacterised protein [Klebsiella pneumoniae]